jgi:uncharacterized protein YhjY with autotransporter beta-barrel domain
MTSLKSTLACGVALFVCGAAAHAAPLSFSTPHISNNAGPVSTTIGGQTFVNQGLQGVARIPAGTKDFMGDTFGAFSSLAVLPGTWHRNADGSYGGTLYALPDRGPNQIGTVNFSDYPGRVNIFSMNLTPYTSSTNLPVSTDSQHQLQLTQTGGFLFRDFNGNVTTGLDPSAPGPNAYVTQNGINLPGSKTGPAAGKISIDAEGLRFLNNGSFYVSDEYGANVYYFDKTGNLQGVITPPPALIPRTTASSTDPNTLSYTSITDAAVGRRLNQGLEGLAITPDSKHLVTLLQSAAMQDSTTDQQTRTNTRLMIYDISGTNKAPTAPVADYVVQLPIYQANGTGAAPNRTAAQSEILALNDTQFLVLARDANGLGQANAPFVYKSILLVDTAGATNIAGTPYETGYTPIATAGVLTSAITPVKQSEVVNILDQAQLGKFGFNLNNAAPTRLTLTEKWEGMALVPALDEAHPQDYFLLVGNDDDFLADNCNVGGQDCAQAVNSDAVVLTYRLTLPTYVDSGYLESMLNTTPVTASMALSASRDLARSYDVQKHLEVLRHAGWPGSFDAGSRFAVWGAGNWSSRDESGLTTATSISTATLGLDAQLDDNLMAGAAISYGWGGADVSGGYRETMAAWNLTAYGAWRQDGLFADASGTFSNQHFHINRPAAYQLFGHGNTDGIGWAATGEVGYLMMLDGFAVGPVAGLQVLSSDVDGYTETGAAGGNILFPYLSTSSVNGFFGAEASGMLGDFAQAIVRVTYNTDDGYDPFTTTVSLANAGNVMGSQSITVPGLGQAHVAPSITLTGTGGFTWWANYGADIGMDAGTEHHVSGGLRINL